MENEKLLRAQLVKLLDSSEAHASYDAAVKDLPVKLRGVTPEGAEHSPWRLVEHLRITLWDILEFSRDAKHVSPEWPKEYWPESDAPPDAGAWDASIAEYHRLLKEMEKLVTDPKTDLFAPIAHGDGQTVLREALLAADHAAYHVGQLVLVRRLLGAWG